MVSFVVRACASLDMTPKRKRQMRGRSMLRPYKRKTRANDNAAGNKSRDSNRHSVELESPVSY
jgi:hypothetical protein